MKQKREVAIGKELTSPWSRCWTLWIFSSDMKSSKPLFQLLLSLHFGQGLLACLVILPNWTIRGNENDKWPSREYGLWMQRKRPRWTRTCYSATSKYQKLSTHQVSVTIYSSRFLLVWRVRFLLPILYFSLITNFLQGFCDHKIKWISTCLKTWVFCYPFAIFFNDQLVVAQISQGPSAELSGLPGLIGSDIKGIRRLWQAEAAEPRQRVTLH